MYAGLALLGAAAAISVEASGSIQSLASVAAILIAAGALWWHVIVREAAAKAPPSSRAAI
jgi:hypothetical protein